MSDLLNRDSAASLSALSRVSPVGRAERLSPLAPIRPEIGLDDLRPNPALIPIGDITQFDLLVYGAQGRGSAGTQAGTSSQDSPVQVFNTDLVADRIELTLTSLRGRIGL